jgi:hypothetical protein
MGGAAADVVERLSWALELHGNIPLAEKFLAQSGTTDAHAVLQEVRRPSFRRFMAEETRPIYLLPVLRCLLAEDRLLCWVMMGGDTNHLAWEALTAWYGVEDRAPVPVKVKVGGPHHGDRDDPALYVISLLNEQEAQGGIGGAERATLKRWLGSLPSQRRAQIGGDLADLPLADAVRHLVDAGLSPALTGRWRVASPRYLEILGAFDFRPDGGLAVDEAWFSAGDPDGDHLLRAVRARYMSKAGEAAVDWRVLDEDGFDRLRHAFSEILGEQVVKLGRSGLAPTTQQGLNILLGRTEIGQLLSRATLFWENGIWTGRTWSALAFAVGCFNGAADWKFGVHTAYPFVHGITSLVDLRSSAVQEGAEDVQGLGRYLRVPTRDGYQLLTYENWIEAHRRRSEMTEDALDAEEIEEHRHLVELLRRRLGSAEQAGLLARFSPGLLIRLYLREKDPRHPDEGHITFKHFQHLTYLDRLPKTSYRALYFPIQRLFDALALLEQAPGNDSLFARLRRLDRRLQATEEIGMVDAWLRYRSLAGEQVGAGLRVLERHRHLVAEYLRGRTCFETVLARVMPDVEPVDVSAYVAELSQVPPVTTRAQCAPSRGGQ